MSILQTIADQRRGATLSAITLLNRIYVMGQRVRRLFHLTRPRVFYPYRSLLYTHPLFFRYYKHPPVPYCNAFNAQLCHWVDVLPEVLPQRSFVIEPIDHPLSPAGRSEPGEVLSRKQRVIDVYMDPRCKRILVESEGQLELFKRYLPNSLLDKTEILRVGAVSQSVDFDKKAASLDTLTFLCLASDYTRKAVDLVLQAWRDFGAKSRCRLILACPNVPSELGPSLAQEKVEIIRKAPLSESEKRSLLEASHIMIAPLHVDGGANIIEAFEYGLPVITMRSQRSFVRKDNGWDIDVPFYFYDPGYGTDWPTWARFWQMVDDAKRNHAFDRTVQEFVRIFELVEKSPGIVLEMGRRSHAMGTDEFSLARRNAALNRIYSTALQTTNPVTV